jgi:hypothetical protein
VTRPAKKRAPGWTTVKVARGLPWKPPVPAKRKPAAKPTGIRKAVAGLGVLKADAAYSKAVRSRDPKAVKAAASKMRTAQRKAGLAADPSKLASVGGAVRAKAAYDQAVASGDERAIRAAAAKLRPFQQAAGPGIRRDRRGRFT